MQLRGVIEGMSHRLFVLVFCVLAPLLVGCESSTTELVAEDPTPIDLVSEPSSESSRGQIAEDVGFPVSALNSGLNRLNSFSEAIGVFGGQTPLLPTDPPVDSLVSLFISDSVLRMAGPDVWALMTVSDEPVSLRIVKVRDNTITPEQIVEKWDDGSGLPRRLIDVSGVTGWAHDPGETESGVQESAVVNWETNGFSYYLRGRKGVDGTSVAFLVDLAETFVDRN